MKYVIANFKMNKTPSEVKDYLINFIPKAKERKNIILCLPAVSISTAKYMLSGTDILIGAQNLSDDEEHRFTGEISGEMLKDAGADYVLIGHSDRRTKFKENSKSLNKKIKLALKNRLKVIFCVGESLAERNTLKMLEGLKNQIEEAFKGLYENELDNIIIAYEPVWAIGSGKIPTIKEIETSVKAIRKVISDDFSAKAGQSINVVYGGSIDDKNIALIKKAKGIDGVLVGKACLDFKTFGKILNQI